MDGRPHDRHHRVVPRRPVAVLVGDPVGLRVAQVSMVVAAGVCEVDPADVGDVARRGVAMTDHHELLMVRPAVAHPHVEQRLGAAVLELLAQRAVLAREEADLVPVRAPDQPAHVDAALVRPGQHVDHCAAGVVGHQQLVGVALPVGEQQHVALAGGFHPLVQLTEVFRSVDQRPAEVALRPGRVGVDAVDARRVVVALLARQEPVRYLAHGSRR